MYQKMYIIWYNKSIGRRAFVVRSGRVHQNLPHATEAKTKNGTAPQKGE
jgi:hypothetical protein